MEKVDDILVINFFGNSCSGKSGHAGGLYAHLKSLGLSVELGTEQCKKWFYEGTRYKLNNQMLITGMQVDLIDTARNGEVKIIIMDSPVLLGSLYTQVYNPDVNLASAIRSKFHSYNNFNILLESDVEFIPEGRGSSGVSRDEIYKLLLREGLVYELESTTKTLQSYKVLGNKILRRLEK